MSRCSTAVLAAVLVAVAIAPTAASADPSFGGEAHDDKITVIARDVAAAEAAAAAVAPAERLVEFRRMTECDPLAVGIAIDGSVCVPLSSVTDLTTPPACDGLPAREPLWRRDRAATTAPWGPWRNVLGWTCPQDYLPAFTAEDFRRLPLDPPTLTVQPDRAEHLVNMPTIVYTAPAAQLLTTDLLGYPVEVEATPTAYTWDFGDGAVLTTTSPGRPYPHHDVAHPYAQPGSYAITLTVTLAGRYRLAGATTWQPVTGTATTTTTSAPITVVEAPTRLVVGDCRTHPQDC